MVPSAFATVPLSLVAPGVTVVFPDVRVLFTVRLSLAGVWPPATVSVGPPLPETLTVSAPVPVSTTRLCVSALTMEIACRRPTCTVSLVRPRVTVMPSLAAVPLTVTLLVPAPGSTVKAPEISEKLNTLA